MERFSYLNRPNLEYIEQQHQLFQQSPDRVDPYWKMFFEGMEFGSAQPDGAGGFSDGFSESEIAVYDLIWRYRDYGHLKANLDPLKLQQRETDYLDFEQLNLSTNDLETTFHIGQSAIGEKLPLKDIIAKLERAYCGTLTAQVAHCEPSVRDWFQQDLESGSPQFQLSKEDRIDIFKSLAKTESLEKFIHSRFVGTKRFSIEGGDALLPMLESLVKDSTKMEVQELVIGMAHRGRVNVLANFMDKALDIILAEFDGIARNNAGYDGDVKYHMGYSADKTTANGPCHISLAFNPSHLEAVNPVVTGMVRAKQRRRKDTGERKTVVPVLIHGDAAFVGQGVVSETFQLSLLEGYRVGGTIHVIINNQVGFTTNPSDARSTRYSSDIAKSVRAPILLVNGDDVEACVRAMNIALRYRQEFKQDVVIDMICYRRYGHNEGDEPAFTQPKMYEAIKKHPTLKTIYTEKLTREGIINSEFAEQHYQEKLDNLQQVLENTRKSPPEIQFPAFEGLWKGLHKATENDLFQPIDTTVRIKSLIEVSQYLTSEPQHIQVHSKIKRLIENRRKMVEENQIDWAMGELLAYATLRNQGLPIRITGQDCIRGTFTHRQSTYYDVKTGEAYCPLKQISQGTGEFCIYNSPLSEMAALGFEYGNATVDPTFLTIWEAQFGDFANGAQIIIDQFISSGEEKWARQNGLVLLLPHGYEGQGPEHSSARLERFLTLCAQNNMQVCNLTTPAQLFHVLRRQLLRKFRKPLVIMSPKSLLRHPKVISTLEDLADGHFQEVLPDPLVDNPKQIESVVFCTGKVYYDILKEREDNPVKTDRLALIRVEQMYPFPKAAIASFLNGFPKLKVVAWAQEEPHNMGAYLRLREFFEDLMDEIGLNKHRLIYIGRPDRSSPATGSPKNHAREQQQIIEEVLNLR